jgi:hypothetical protein
MLWKIEGQNKWVIPAWFIQQRQAKSAHHLANLLRNAPVKRKIMEYE